MSQLRWLPKQQANKLKHSLLPWSRNSPLYLPGRCGLSSSSGLQENCLEAGEEAQLSTARTPQQKRSLGKVSAERTGLACDHGWDLTWGIGSELPVTRSVQGEARGQMGDETQQISRLSYHKQHLEDMREQRYLPTPF